MKVKASIIVMSHLSDTQIEMHIESLHGQANTRLNFAKFIILKTDGNLNLEIDPEKLYKEFTTQLKVNPQLN